YNDRDRECGSPFCADRRKGDNGRLPSRRGAWPEMVLTVEGMVLYSEDLDRARAFYRDVLGLPLLLDEGHVIHFDAGTIRLAIHRCPPGQRREAPGGRGRGEGRRGRRGGGGEARTRAAGQRSGKGRGGGAGGGRGRGGGGPRRGPVVPHAGVRRDATIDLSADRGEVDRRDPVV